MGSFSRVRLSVALPHTRQMRTISCNMSRTGWNDDGSGGAAKRCAATRRRRDDRRRRARAAYEARRQACATWRAARDDGRHLRGNMRRRRSARAVERHGSTAHSIPDETTTSGQSVATSTKLDDAMSCSQRRREAWAVVRSRGRSSARDRDRGLVMHKDRGLVMHKDKDKDLDQDFNVLFGSVDNQVTSPIGVHKEDERAQAEPGSEFMLLPRRFRLLSIASIEGISWVETHSNDRSTDDRRNLFTFSRTYRGYEYRKKEMAKKRRAGRWRERGERDDGDNGRMVVGSATARRRRKKRRRLGYNKRRAAARSRMANTEERLADAAEVTMARRAPPMVGGHDARMAETTAMARIALLLG
ncbi:hypothetical protein Scep_026439 [Stephania cephalantha]|uniref:Uncharacterized protein n=1 Tax=Stephania cephalantha TaxID=152367 RepID=A0AAP0EMQ1_9MAGN